MFRPGLLLCKRDEQRTLEWIAQKITPVFDWVAGGRLCIPTDTLAKAMIIDASQSNDASFTLLHNKDISSKVVY